MPAQLMLLPGLMCDARMFAAQRVRFPDALVIDGFGTRDSLGAMAEFALTQAPARFALLGHSMGGRVALEMYRRAPERIERLALVSTGVHDVQPGEADKRHALIDLSQQEGVEALVDRWLLPMIARGNLADAALIGPLRAMCADVGVDVFAAQVSALLGRPEVATLLPGIACPTLVAVGSEDSWSPPVQHEAIAAAIPGARLSIIPGAGHMLPAEAPEALNDAIAAWLSLPVQHRTDTTGEKNDR